MGLEDLLPQQNGQNKKRPQKKNKIKSVRESQHSFTVRHDVSTKVLLDRILKLKELTTPGAHNITRGSVVREALELLANEMDYVKLEKKYADFIAHIDNSSILN